MRNWRQLTAAIGGVALTLGVLVTAPSLASESEPGLRAAAAEVPGGIEIWGDEDVSLPTADGPWSAFGAHQGSSVARNQLVIRADGTLQALPGTAANLANIPSAAAGETVVDAGLSHVQTAWAVTADGNLHKWGGARGTVIQDRTVTPADLDAPGRSIVEASGHYQGSSFLVRFDDGSAVMFDALLDELGPIVPLNDGQPLTDVISLAADADGGRFALRSDGSIAKVSAAGWSIAVPADAGDPVVDMALASNGDGSAVRASGAVIVFTADGASADTSFDALTGITGRPVQIARAGASAAVRTDTGDVYAWNPRTDSVNAAPEAFQPPSALNGMDVQELAGGNGVFRAIVTESDDPDLPALEVTDQPTIAGDASVGETLTATPAVFNETDGVTITHQWFADGEPIDGATETTYELTEAEEGATITYVSTANRPADGAELASDPSNELGPVEAGFQITEEPTIFGDPFIGVRLEAFLAPTNGFRPQNSIQWQAGDGETFEDIDGATSALYTVPEELDGQFIRFVQTARSGGETASRPSAVVGPVREAPVEFAVDQQPTIEGEGQVGETLTATPATFTDDEGVTVEHQWFADGEPIEGATGTTLTLAVEHEGSTITYVTSATRAIDGAEAASDPSNEIGPVVPIDLAITGQPTITGQPFIGETLTAEPADVSDDRADTTFRWFAGDGEEFAVIDGATGSSLELTEALRDQQVKVVQTATRSLDEASDTAESIAVGPVTDAPEELTVETEAELTGTPRVGETLTGTPATFSTTEDVTVTNFWVIGDTEVEADGTTLVLTDDEVGQNIQFKSVATRGDESVPSTSNTVGPVLVVLAATEAPAISGTPQVGETLSGTPARFNDTEGVTVTNRWLADGEPIAGATGNSLELTDDHVGQEITFESTATRGDETASDVSEPVGPVELAPVTEESKPTISGTPQVGEKLTGTPATFSATDDVTVTNQWLADGEPIAGATGTELELTADHVGAEITFESTAVRGDEEPVVSTSEATARVSPADPGGSGDEDGISAPETFSPGDTITVSMSEDYAGQMVSVWLFSTPRELGTFEVSEEGTISVPIPEDVDLGEHQLAVYDEAGQLIGSQAVSIVSDDGVGGIPAPGGVPGVDVVGGSGLPDTGAPSALWMLIPLGVAFLLAGAVSLRIGRRETT